MDALNAWYNEIINHIQNNGLINLSEYEVQGKKIFYSFTDVTRAKKTLKSFSYSDFKHADDFNFLSQDLIYCIAVLELLRPAINNSVKEGGTYYQSKEDHLYLRYAGFGFQTIYSFWDRIGDFLDFFFDTKQRGDVYLSRVLDRFPLKYRSHNYEELLSLYQSKVLPVLTERHSLVHEFTLKAKHFWGVMEHGNNDFKKMEALQLEKDSYPTIFKEHLQYMFKAFELMLMLVSELPDKDDEALEKR